jgi:hypothetical protein
MFGCIEKGMYDEGGKTRSIERDMNMPLKADSDIYKNVKERSRDLRFFP